MEETNKLSTRKRSIKKTSSSCYLYSIKPKYRNDVIIKLFINILCLKHNTKNIENLNFEQSIFGEVDDKGSVTLKKIIENQSGILDILDEEDIKYFIKYIYLLQARNPKIMKNTEIGMRDVLREGSDIYNKIVSSFGKDAFDNSFKNLMEDNNLSKLVLLDNCLDSSALLNLYQGIEYIIININEPNNSFITSNYPYASFPDIGDKKSIHVFPYSPRACLAMTHNKSLIKFLLSLKKEKKEKIVVNLVNFIISISSTEIYSKDDKIGNEVGKYINLLEYDRDRARKQFELFLDEVINDNTIQDFSPKEHREGGFTETSILQTKEKKNPRFWKWFSKH
ncbi:DUF4238 domain-containing protein [Acetobacter oryzoeni]|uniref:DUF4238 domain-containing protein n=1 Tax=Acetobacter oryzoeni TaxID=2500548 RepID=UPI001FCBB9D5|nr:DUF4238 domain-containing protein [Acetobacter oryzoeni]MCP1202813.1 DUF4238 domain-containing protein [Acetobacter oryzoeni]